MNQPTPQKQKKSAHNALLEIRRILCDPSLSDSECLEHICRVYESLPDMPKTDRRAPERTSAKPAVNTIPNTASNK